MRTFVSQPCIRTGLITMFAIRGAYCPNSPLPSIHVTKLFKVLAKCCPLAASLSSLFFISICSFSFLLVFSYNMGRFSVFSVTQNSKRIHCTSSRIGFLFGSTSPTLIVNQLLFPVSISFSIHLFFFLSAPPPQFQWLRSAEIREQSLRGLRDSLSSPPSLQNGVSQFTSDR